MRSEGIAIEACASVSGVNEANSDDIVQFQNSAKDREIRARCMMKWARAYSANIETYGRNHRLHFNARRLAHASIDVRRRRADNAWRLICRNVSLLTARLFLTLRFNTSFQGIAR